VRSRVECIVVDFGSDAAGFNNKVLMFSPTHLNVEKPLLPDYSWKGKVRQIAFSGFRGKQIGESAGGIPSAGSPRIVPTPPLERVSDFALKGEGQGWLTL
jgi:hypothetical protein